MRLPAEAAFDAWLAAVEARHLERLTFSEVRRSLQALSSLYVHRRKQLRTGAALDGAGKRAAFAMFYAPLHYLVTERIVAALGDSATSGLARIQDLGCGTGAAGAAWARAADRQPRLAGADLHPWAVAETHWNWSRLGLSGRARVARIEREPLSGRGTGILLAYAVNELGDVARPELLERLLEAAAAGARVLVVEPIARRATPWWDTWAERFRGAGGRVDAWRFPAELPGPLARLDRAAGLDHRELTARTLFVR